MKNAKNKAIGMDGEYDLPKAKVPMRNDMQAKNAYPNPSANTLKVKKGGSLEKILKASRLTESERTTGKKLPWRDM